MLTWLEREPGCSTLRHIEDDNIAQDWEEACEKSQVEPYKLEIFEHWCVSSWLAEKLEAKGERVDQDFGGLCVWGRTTSGQAISMDGVICDIYDALMS